MRSRSILIFIFITFFTNCDVDRMGLEEKERYDSQFDYLDGKTVLDIILNQYEFWFISVTESKIEPPPESSHLLCDMQLSLLKNSKFDYYDMSINHISNIIFDRDGLMYATSGCKVLKIENLQTHSTLYEHADFITSLAFDHDNNLWFGDYNNGIFIWDGKELKNFNSQNSSLQTNEIHDIVIYKNNTKWIALGIDYNGLLKIEDDKWQYFKCSDLIDDEYHYFSHLILDKNNNLWIGYKGKFLIYNGIDWSFSEPFIYQDDRKEILSLLTSDIFGNIWVVYKDRYLPQEEVLSDIYFYDGDKWKKPVENFNGIVCDLELDENNQLWIGAYHGLFTYSLLQNK